MSYKIAALSFGLAGEPAVLWASEQSLRRPKATTSPGGPVDLRAAGAAITASDANLTEEPPEPPRQVHVELNDAELVDLYKTLGHLVHARDLSLDTPKSKGKRPSGLTKHLSAESLARADQEDQNTPRQVGRDGDAPQSDTDISDAPTMLRTHSTSPDPEPRRERTTANEHMNHGKRKEGGSGEARDARSKGVGNAPQAAGGSVARRARIWQPEELFSLNDDELEEKRQAHRQSLSQREQSAQGEQDRQENGGRGGPGQRESRDSAVARWFDDDTGPLNNPRAFLDEPRGPGVRRVR